MDLLRLNGQYFFTHLFQINKEVGFILGRSVLDGGGWSDVCDIQTTLFNHESDVLNILLLQSGLYKDEFT